MRVLIQRVDSAHVETEGATVGVIGRGVVLFWAAKTGDAERDVKWLADKVAGLRIFPDGAGKMNRSLLEIGGAALVVSQFTLYGDCRRGRRPSFERAMAPIEASRLYEQFCVALEIAGVRQVERGRFQAHMLVSLINHGPVTLMLESSED